ncbi:MAG: HDOD domain-containing protein [Desulfobacteraceae bacterium]|nr:HDOD domain-containing protein [Desulfobacteraceae bacterium]
MENTLVGEKTIAFSIAQEILLTNVNIPTIPANATKILAIVRQPKDQIDIPLFVKLVESDPGLFTRILQLANSPFYTEMEKIVSLRAAITRIGLIEIINSVCLYFFQKLLPTFPDLEGFSYDNFWAYSWACAIANRRLGHPNLEMGVLPGELYMTGMLHGVGKLLLAMYFPNEFSLCLKKARELKVPLTQVERDVFETTDALVASNVLKSWNLPANVCEGVAFHQMPELAPPEHVIIAGLTQFAYVIAGQSELGCNGDGIKMDLPSTYLGQLPKLKFSKPEVQEKLVQEILNSLKNKAESVISIPPKPQVQRRESKKTYALPSTKTSNQNKKLKKGVLGWVKSLWNKN